MASGQAVSIRRRRIGFRQARRPSSSPPAPCRRCGWIFGPRRKAGMVGRTRWIGGADGCSTKSLQNSMPIRHFRSATRHTGPFWTGPGGRNHSGRHRSDCMCMPNTGSGIPAGGRSHSASIWNCPLRRKPHAPATAASASPACMPVRPMHSKAESIMPGAVRITSDPKKGKPAAPGAVLCAAPARLGLLSYRNQRGRRFTCRRSCARMRRVWHTERMQASGQKRLVAIDYTNFQVKCVNRI